MQVKLARRSDLGFTVIEGHTLTKIRTALEFHRFLKLDNFVPPALHWDGSAEHDFGMVFNPPGQYIAAKASQTVLLATCYALDKLLRAHHHPFPVLANISSRQTGTLWRADCTLYLKEDQL